MEGKGLAFVVVLFIAAAAVDGMLRGDLSTDPDGAVVPTPSIVAPPALDQEISLTFTAPGFVENRGQLGDGRIEFYAEGDPLSVGITNEGVIYAMRAPGSAARDGPVDVVSFSMRLLGSRPSEAYGVENRGYPCNFFLGDDPGRWASGAGNFKEVRLDDVYDGVDVRYRLEDGLFKYYFEVYPGAQVDQVVMKYAGVERLAVDPPSGDLMIETGLGTLRDSRPVMIQLTKGGAVVRAFGEFVLDGNDQVSFAVPGAIDQSGPFTIDPGILFSTYVGGSGYDIIEAVDIDRWGNVHVVGMSSTVGFPPEDGYYHESIGSDVFGMIIPRGMGTPLASYRIGGNSFDDPSDLRVLEDGSIWISGYTTSTDFPTVDNLYASGGDYDVFLLRLSNGSSDLVFSSYLSGIAMEFVAGIDVDPSGNLYITGRTLSIDFPTTAGAYCRTMINPVAGAVFVAKFSYSPVRLVYCTLIDARDSEFVNDIAVDESGRAYIVGTTQSTPEDGFPVTFGAYDVWLSAGGSIFIVRLNSSATSVERGTYLGGWGSDIVTEMALLTDGSVIVTGSTDSSDFPTTPSAYSDAIEGANDCILAILDSELSTLKYSTFFGGDDEDYGGGLAVSPDGTICSIVGRTASMSIPMTIGAFDGLMRGTDDMFLACFDLRTKGLTYSTRLGGSYFDSAYHGLSVWNGTASIILGGFTNSTDFPVTANAYSSTYGGGEFDGFLLEVEPVPCTRGPLPPTALEATSGDTVVDLMWRPPVLRECQAAKYSIYRANETTSGDLEMVGNVGGLNTTFQDTQLKNGHRYRYQVSAWNGLYESAMSDPVYGFPKGRPMPPASLGWETGDGSIVLRWSPPIEDGGQLRGYRVMRGVDESSIDVHIMTVSNSTLMHTDFNVEIGSHYWYNVIAFNDFGNSTPSNKINATPIGAPSVPRNFRAHEGDGYIDLGWDPPTSDGGAPLIGYRISRGDTQFDLTLLDETDAYVRTYRDPDRVNGKAYYYSIQASNNNRTSAPALADKFPASPYGPPSAPENVIADPGDGMINLSWRPPREANGRPVTQYCIWVAQAPGGEYLFLGLGNVTTYRYDNAINEVEYYFKVQARNARGWGINSTRVNATPEATPDPPTGLTAISERDGIRLTWTAPDWMGRDRLSYEVHRGNSTQDLQFLHGGLDVLSYLDTSARIGVESFYVVLAKNSAGGRSRPSNWASAVREMVPGDVVNPKVTAGDKEVVLAWEPPTYDGGSDILYYEIRRGPDASTLTEIHKVQGAPLNWTDRGLTNGQNYTYAILAVNRLGASPVNRTWTVMPLAVSGVVMLNPLHYKDGRVVLSWTVPDYPDRLPPTSLVIYKGRSPDRMVLVATLDPSARNWTDSSVDEGTTYYYIQTICSRGPGERTELAPVEGPAPSAGSWWVFLIIVVIAVLVAWMAMAMGRRRAVEITEPGKAGADLVVEVGAAGPSVAGAALAATGPHHLVEEVFVIYKDGRLIAECSRDTCKTKDADLMSGMLIAVQGIVQEGLQKGGELESIKYGENLIVIKSGAHVNVAAIIYGEPDTALTEELEATVERVEVSYSGIIEHWDGDLTPLSGMTEMVKPLFEKTAELTRADIKGPAPAPSVSLLSSIDFHRGYVRLKLAVVNATRESVTDASIEVHYDHDMLRMERVIPVSLEVRGDSIILGNVRPEERKSVALLLDPQICHGTHIDGTLVYYDPKGELRRVEMKRRRADVVCPIFFTKTHANTAMLRRLITEKLHHSDVRAFRYPEGLASTSILDLGRRALAGNAIQMVRQYIKEGPPYYAEVWYYGETKIRGNQIVMRLGVIEEKRALEFFAASTDMEPITGLLADFKREMDRLLAESHPGGSPMVPLRSEAVLGEIEGRTLLIDERDGPMVE